METQYATLREKIAAETAARKTRYADFEKWIVEASQAGVAAVAALQVTPMVVAQHENPMDDGSPVTKSYFVADGPCGFAWVTVMPANCSFAIWAKKTQGWTPAYGGGLQMWVHAYNQSMQRKEAYAYAYAAVLSSHGIHAYAGSRMD
jgi:hypothetical protein